MTCTARTSSTKPMRRGLVLIELLIVVSLIGMLTAIGTISFGAMWGNLEFKRQANELIHVFQMAQDAAGRSDRRYAVVLDIAEQTYVLRQFQTLADLQVESPVPEREETWAEQPWRGQTAYGEYDAYDEYQNEDDWIPTDESIIHTGYFTETFYLDYVVWDDGKDTRTFEDEYATLRALFMAGHAGWMNGGVVVLRDEEGDPWSIVISRLGRPVRLVEGEVGILLPRKQNEVLF